MGYTHEQTARLIGPPPGIAQKTLVKHFKAELATGADLIGARIAANLASIAMDKQHRHSAIAAIYWTKARLGWQRDDEAVIKLNSRKGFGDLPVEFTLRLGPPGDDVLPRTASESTVQEPPLLDAEPLHQPDSTPPVEAAPPAPTPTAAPASGTIALPNGQIATHQGFGRWRVCDPDGREVAVLSREQIDALLNPGRKPKASEPPGYVVWKRD